MSETKNLAQLRETLEKVSIQELRQKAVKNFGIKLTREMTKDDIINQIIGMSHKAEFAGMSEGDLKPGWARIRVHPVNGRMFPFYVNCNGYQCFIPFNVEVDVPRKVLGVLNDAEEFRVTADEYGNEQKSFELSYPFSIIQDVPGPDPRPGYEVQREIYLKPKYRFREKFGYWPTDKALQQYREGNLIPENDD